jgi:hypothetical protein
VVQILQIIFLDFEFLSTCKGLHIGLSFQVLLTKKLFFGCSVMLHLDFGMEGWFSQISTSLSTTDLDLADSNVADSDSKELHHQPLGRPPA